MELAGLAPVCWWTKDGAALADDTHYATAHSSSLLIRDFNVEDAGAYQVVASNSFGVVTSAVVNVRIACVDGASTTPAAPYASWETAAQTLQAAVDAAPPGAVVLVTNGIYNTGARYVAGDMTNRLVLDKAVTVLSRNGPEQTVIEGAWDPASTNGAASVRCVWMGPDAVLGGFTLRQGSTPLNGGGVWNAALGLQPTVLGCVITNCRAAGKGGGVFQGHLRDCMLTGNAAWMGGGTAWSFAEHCSLRANAAGSGGAAYQGMLSGCEITSNTASVGGGAVYGSQLWSCLVATNAADGIRSAIARNCRLLKNVGSGAVSSTVQGSLLMGNTSCGANTSTNLNCNLVGNGMAVYGGYSTNCIFWFNSSPSLQGTKTACILQPGESTASPGSDQLWLCPNLLSDGWHLAKDSPAFGRGTSAGVNGTDLDGQPWGNPPPIGCDEWNPQLLLVSPPRVLPGSRPGEAALTVELAGLEPYCWWTRDGASIEEGSHYAAAHSSALVVRDFNLGDAGAYQVVASNSFGVVTSAVVTVSVACVDAASLSPAPPYASWDSAAHTIQEAVDAAPAGTVVLVTNGIYRTGGRWVAGDMTNRVVLDKALTVLSCNGPEQTIIEGAWDPASTNGPASVRCAWVGEEAVLGGFTLRNGSIPYSGGGVRSPSLGLRETTVGCVITNCRAAGQGGGAYQGRLRQCVLAGNTAGVNGGGSALAMLDHCLLQANTAPTGGGLFGGVARGCRILANTASQSGGGGTGPGVLLGCALALNRAADSAGVYNSMLYQCTVVSNTASASTTAGVNFCGVWNSIVYFNRSLPDASYSGTFENVGGCLFAFQNMCYSPYRGGLPGCITNNPQLLDLWHVAAASPCRGTGTNFPNIGFADLDGEAWASPPAIGCDEVDESALTGTLFLTVAAGPEVAAGGVLPLVASLTGRASQLQWSFGDGTAVADAGFSTSHVWTNAGDYTVTATAFNRDNPAGVTSTVSVHVVPVSPPQLTAPLLSGPTLSLQFTGQPGLTYEFQSATNLAPPILWQAVQTLNSTGGVMTVTAPQATGPACYYRLQIR